MTSPSESLDALDKAKPQRKSASLKVLAKISPERAAIKESFMSHYHALMDAAVDMDDMLKQQEDRLPPRARRSLVPSTGKARIKALIAAAEQTLEIATLIGRIDVETGAWCLPEVPPLPGDNLLPHQDQAFLDGLGSYHKLYVGKYAYLYGKGK